MCCEHCKGKEAYIYDVEECEIFRIGNLLHFRYYNKDGYEDVHSIEITHCPWCGSKLGDTND